VPGLVSRQIEESVSSPVLSDERVRIGMWTKMADMSRKCLKPASREHQALCQFSLWNEPLVEGNDRRRWSFSHVRTHHTRFS